MGYRDSPRDTGTPHQEMGTVWDIGTPHGTQEHPTGYRDPPMGPPGDGNPMGHRDTPHGIQGHPMGPSGDEEPHGIQGYPIGYRAAPWAHQEMETPQDMGLPHGTQ